MWNIYYWPDRKEQRIYFINICQIYSNSPVQMNDKDYFFLIVTVLHFQNKINSKIKYCGDAISWIFLFVETQLSKELYRLMLWFVYISVERRQLEMMKSLPYRWPTPLAVWILAEMVRSAATQAWFHRQLHRCLILRMGN